MTRDEKCDFIEAYDRCGVRLPWAQGDVAVVCNVRTAHGPPPLISRQARCGASASCSGPY